MLQLRILGPAEIRDDEGVLDQSFLSGRKRLTLLTYMTLDRPRGYKRRDSLLPLFWPNHGQKNARNALSNMLYHMRQSLGNDIIINRGKEEIELAEIWCDVTAFEEAIEQKNYQEALQVYRGPLLEGLHIPDASQQLEQWLDNERERLRRKYLQVLKQLAQNAEQHGEAEKAAKWWYKVSREDSFDSSAVRHLMKALIAENRKPEAIRVGQNHVQLLEKEFGSHAAEEFQKLTNNIDKAASAFKERSVDVKAAELDQSTIAVLPFENLNGNENISIFATGLHNDLLTKLSTISALSVIARTSASYYQDKNRTISEIAQKLEAGTIVEGSVQHNSERIRLHVQLTDARNEQLLWADTYDRKLTANNLFEIQNELAEKVVETLKAKLTPKEKERIEDKPTEDIEAYHGYVQGRTHLAQRTERGINRALTYFQQAIDKDSSYALAWAGLAEALVLLEFYSYPIPEEVPDALTAAQKALQLGPELAESHASLGILHASRKQGPEAKRELKQAIELQPSYAEAHNWLGWLYMILGEHSKAIEPAERATELDPMAPFVRAYMSKIYIADGQYELALRESRNARQLQPEFALTHFMEGLSLYHLGRFSEALFALKETLLLVGPKRIPSESEIRAALALTYSASGNESEVRRLLAQVQETSDHFSEGLILATLGKSKEAFKSFESVKEWGYFSTAYIRYFFPDVLNPLRKDSEYKDILRQVDKSWRS